MTFCKWHDVREDASPLNLFLGMRCGYICFCDTMIAEIQICSQGNVQPGHCISEETGLFSSEHSFWQPPSYCYALVMKKGQKAVNTSPDFLAILGKFPEVPIFHPIALQDSPIQWKTPSSSSLKAKETGKHMSPHNGHIILEGN